jgi:hypothetical protein
VRRTIVEVVGRTVVGRTVGRVVVGLLVVVVCTTVVGGARVTVVACPVAR